jgi:hypothetical protein
MFNFFSASAKNSHGTGGRGVHSQSQHEYFIWEDDDDDDDNNNNNNNSYIR